MIKELNFEVTKKDPEGNPIECKLTAVGDFIDLQKAMKVLSANVLKTNEQGPKLDPGLKP
jgi:hypothetical protein